MKDEIAPGFLIAVPQLLDRNFFHSVVFLIEHHEEGAFGVVINRPSEVKVQELLDNLGLKSSTTDAEARVMIGGPVQPDRCLVFHTEGCGPGDSRALTDSIFVSSTPNSLERLYSRPNPHAVWFAGYSGWGPGQLEKEIGEGAWIPASIDESIIFDVDRNTLWDRALRGIGIDPRFLVRGAVS